MTDVFISYRRDDRSRIELIAEKLRALKVDAWFDARLEAGKSFSAEIARELDKAACVLACWSPGAVASDWVRGEAAEGLRTQSPGGVLHREMRAAAAVQHGARGRSDAVVWIA
jgi:TIR domain